MNEQINSVDFWVDELTKDTEPEGCIRDMQNWNPYSIEGENTVTTKENSNG